MKQIKAFQTTDGQLFDDKAQAEKHQLFLSKQDTINEYLKSEMNPYKGRTQQSITRTTIINWELWKVKQNAPE